MLPIKSAVLVGSLRKESFSRKVAKALISVTPKSAILEILEIGQSPTYNRSVPALLKNALDSKPCAMINVSIGSLGGFGANHHLRQSLFFLNEPAMALPEAYLANASKLFHQTRKLIDPATGEFLTVFMSSFVDWVQANTHKVRQVNL